MGKVLIIEIYSFQLHVLFSDSNSNDLTFFVLPKDLCYWPFFIFDFNHNPIMG